MLMNLLDFQELRSRANKQSTVSNGRSAQHWRAHVVDRKNFQFRAVVQNDNVTIFAGNVDLAVSVNRRCKVIGRIVYASRSEQRFSFSRFKAGCDPTFLDQQHAVIHNEWRHNVVGVFRWVLPQHMSRSHIPTTTAFDRQHVFVCRNGRIK